MRDDEYYNRTLMPHITAYFRGNPNRSFVDYMDSEMTPSRASIMGITQSIPYLNPDHLGER